MSTVLTTDWLIVSRGGKPYRCHVSDFVKDVIPPADIPSATSLVLSDVPGGARFTSVHFPLLLTMAEDGKPASAKGLKAWVTGTRTWQPTTDVITAVGSATGPVYSNWLTSSNGWFSNIVTHVPALAFNGHHGAQDFAASNTLGKLTFTVPAGTFKGPIEVGIDAGKWTKGANTVTCGGVAKDPFLQSTTRHGKEAVWFDLTGDFTSFTVQSHSSGWAAYLFAVYVNGVELIDGAPEPLLTFASDKGLDHLKPGEVLTQNDSKASGTIQQINKVSNTITLGTTTGTWGPANAGHFAHGPTVTENNVVQYCKINASGAVSALQDADPGYVDQTATPTTLNFPATFTPSGVPDTLLPAGTKLTAEVRAHNIHGDSIVTSNTITPA